MTSRRQVVRFVVPVTDAELAADALWLAGPTAISTDELGDGTMRLTADVSDLGAVELRWPLEVIDVDEATGLDAWREHASAVRAGRRLVLQPAWLPADAGAEDLVVLIDPGHAFGSGSHPTTRLVLAVLEDHLRGGERVLDVGTGSGVLAVGACLLGAGAVTAIDVDPDAIEATESNAARNGVADRVTATAAPLAEVAGEHDVVVANIGGRVLRELHDDLLRRAAPGGLVVLAGFLDAQADEVRAAYRTCTEVDRRSEEGWTALVLRC